MKITSANITGSLIINGTDVTNTLTTLNTFSSSINTRTTNLEVTSSALTSSLNALSASVYTTSGSVSSTVVSYGTRIGNLETTGSALSGSILSVSSSLYTTSGSLGTRIGTIESKYATTGSNTFSGNQTITGTITAQTLIVQTVTSSVVYSSGSNTFGNSSSNTQTMYGAVNVIGSVSASAYTGAGTGLTSIPNSALTNNSITVNGVSVALGGTLTQGQVLNGAISGSGQVAIASTSGFGTYINQALLTTSSPTFAAVSATTFTGALSGNATTATSISGYNNPTTAATANTIVYRDGSGHITGNYVFSSYFNTSGGGAERNSSGLSYIAGFNSSDYYIRSYNSTAVAAMIGLSNYLPLSGGTITGNVIVSGDNYTTYGPNSTWTSYLRVGGNGRTVSGDSYASVVTTNGNLHLDAGNSRAIYLNYYGGTTGVVFGSGASGVVASMDSSGNLWKGTSVGTGTQYVYNSGTWGINVTGYSTSVYIGNTSSKLIADSVWAGAGGYPGYQFTGGNSRFGFSSTSGYIDVYTDGNFYAGIDLNGSNNLVWHQGNLTNLSQLSNGPGYQTSSGTVTNTTFMYTQFLGTSSTNISDGRCQALRNENGSGGNYSYAPVLHMAASDTMWQLQGSYGTSGNGTMQFRQGYAGSWGNWLSIITSANIGSQSVNYASSAGSISGQANSATINATSGNSGNQIVLRDGNGDIAIGTLNANYAYFGGGGRGLTSADTYGSYGNVMTYGTGLNNWYGYGIYDNSGNRSFFMSNSGNFGIYGQSIGHWAFYYSNSTASYSIGSSDAVAGYTLYLIYGLYTVGLYNASDARMKKDIAPLSNSLDKIKLLRGVSYEYIDKGEDGTKNKGVELGFIAQEVLPVIPELIRYDDKKGYAMNYNGVSAVLVEAIKEQQIQIENQQNQINTLISQLTELLNK